MWEYLAAHPWWALIYLVVICMTIAICAGALAGSRKPRVVVEAPPDREDLH